LSAEHVIKAGAPDVGGGKSSPSDALIFRLGRSAVAKAGTTGWQAYQQAALDARKQGGKKSLHNAAIAAVKAGAPDVGGGKSSSSDASIFRLGGGKSTAGSWTQHEDLARTAMKKGGANKAAITRAAGMVEPIATHSHECAEPLCRRPVKLATHFIAGKWYFYLQHWCPVTGTNAKGWGKHMCRTCHQTSRVCQDAICKYSKCSQTRAVCAHLHDGSVLTELRK